MTMGKVKVSDNRFSTDITIPCYDTDASFHLKPAAFMDHAQEMAYLAAQALHFGYDDLQKHHTAWVLSRLRMDFHNPPKWTDETTLYTWHKGLDGLFFLRDFELRAKDDTDFGDKSKVLVSCTSSWIVMNVQTRRLVRSDEVLDIVPAATQCPDNAIPTPCGKVVMPKGVTAEEVGIHKASYSDIDVLGHTNNARYVVWAMDSIDYGEVAGNRVRSISVNFIKETKPEEEVRLFRSVVVREDGHKTYFIEGKIEDKPCFCAQIDF
ncbi:acyl-ACP thioesterase [Alistipes sp. CAG:514]|nr:acyl-ACP thioesterase [Alistipes sp. CAG:514]